MSVARRSSISPVGSSIGSMTSIEGNGVDLNLLITLDALLAERSVTRAARRLGLGQPAVSHALARLRALLADPLLVRSGRTMIPTPRAEALREPLTRVLADVTRLVRQEASFDPSETTRRFTVICHDLLATALPRVVARLRTEAPGARLELVARSRDDADALLDGRADLFLGPVPSVGPGLRTRGLGALHFGVVARRDHPALADGRPLSLGDWIAYPHVVVRSGGSSVGRALAHEGVTRVVGLVVPSFLAALVVVAETDLFFAAPQELLQPAAMRLGLTVLAPPVPIPAMPVAAVWHERFDADPGHRFLRTRVSDEILASLRRWCWSEVDPPAVIGRTHLVPRAGGS